ncbi:hypothetical protein ACUXZZ_28495 [Streptomyces graminifolii]|uniref:hypothetical protein n=1 Tax=Streptomyces graminifolii TaxID=1266771 RepID=UPI00405A0F9F
MKPTPGWIGCPGPSSSATNTPNDSIDATVPVSVTPGRNRLRNAQSSGFSLAAIDIRTRPSSGSTATTSPLTLRPTTATSEELRPQGRSNGPTSPSG